MSEVGDVEDENERLGKILGPAQRVLVVVVLLLIVLSLSQWIASSRSAQRAVDATTGVQTTTSLIGFTQRESLSTAVVAERWLAGAVSRRDVQIARALLARRLSTVDEAGEDAAVLAGAEYLAALKGFDQALAGIPPGVLPDEDRAVFRERVDPIIEEFVEESKQLSDRYQNLADAQLSASLKEASNNNLKQTGIVTLTFLAGLVLFVWLAADIRRKFRFARRALRHDRIQLESARVALERVAEFDQGEADILEKIISDNELAGVLEGIVALANDRAEGARIRLIVGRSLIDPMNFSGAAQLRDQSEIPDEVSPGAASEFWDLATDDGVPTGRVELVGDVAQEHKAEVARVVQRCADLASLATNRYHAAGVLRYQATHDALTGLANRAELLNQINLALLGGETDGDGSAALLFIDLDRFKLVNDSLGHKSGDLLLVEVSDRLRSLVGSDPRLTVARLGGDEFVILMSDVNRLADAEGVADRVVASLIEPVDIDDAEVFVNASIGVAFAGPHVKTAEQLLRNADLAMYRAKRVKSGGYVVYNAAIEADVAERLETDSALRRAVERDELRMYLQPIVDMVDLHTVSYEALVRWERAGHGLVMPDQFISLAEDTGVIVELGEWMLRSAISLIADQRKISGSELTIAVNISARQLLEPGFAYRVLSTLFAFNVDPSSLVLELTESSLIELSTSGSVLERLRQSGVRVAMDDFGTGYSSLLQLQTLPIDIVKLDRAFIAGLSSEPGRRHAVLAAATTLVQASGLELIVEGVETEYEREELLRLDCRLGQGYLFARPGPVQEMLVPA